MQAVWSEARRKPESRRRCCFRRSSAQDALGLPEGVSRWFSRSRGREIDLASFRRLPAAGGQAGGILQEQHHRANAVAARVTGTPPASSL
jgi:hypothetical protein